MIELYTTDKITLMKDQVQKLANKYSVREYDVMYAAWEIASSGLVKVKLERDLR